jgi:hypothetical protein
MLHPEWQWEVGFANLAFGIAAVVACTESWGIKAQGIVIFAYAVYLLQAAILHTYFSFSGGRHEIARFVRSGLLTFAYCAMMLYFVYYAWTAPLS